MVSLGGRVHRLGHGVLHLHQGHLLLREGRVDASQRFHLIENENNVNDYHTTGY